MNKSSKNLTFEQNQKVFAMLGNRKESISTAYVQLLFATNTSPSKWEVKVTGVACFVKDPIRKSYFIEVSGLIRYYDTTFY